MLNREDDERPQSNCRRDYVKKVMSRRPSTHQRYIQTCRYRNDGGSKDEEKWRGGRRGRKDGVLRDKQTTGNKTSQQTRSPKASRQALTCYESCTLRRHGFGASALDGNHTTMNQTSQAAAYMPKRRDEDEGRGGAERERQNNWVASNFLSIVPSKAAWTLRFRGCGRADAADAEAGPDAAEGGLVRLMAGKANLELGRSSPQAHKPTSPQSPQSPVRANEKGQERLAPPEGRKPSPDATGETGWARVEQKARPLPAPKALLVVLPVSSERHQAQVSVVRWFHARRKAFGSNQQKSADISSMQQRHTARCRF